MLRVKHRPTADMLLNYRQLPSVGTPGASITMSNTQGGTPATDEASVPAATTAAESQPTSAAESSSAAAAPTSESVAEPATSAAASSSQAQESSSAQETQPAETTAAASSSDNPVPSTEPSSSQQQSSSSIQSEQTSAAAPTQPATSSSDTNNDSSSQDNQTSSSRTSEVEVSTVVTVTNSDGAAQTSVVVIRTITTNQAATGTSSETAATTTSASKDINNSGGSSGGLSQQSKVAIGVVVPIAAIAILALIGLFWWKKRRSRKQAEEERRKEVEDYAYNPNADPTIPAVGMTDGSYEMREDASSGYRGWGNTTVGSTGRKASTTMSGGQTGQAYSDATSPTAHMSDGRSGEPLMDGSYSPEGEILGAMGPSSANNRGGDVHRGPSNASSSYSAARSDGSDPMGTSYGAGGTYYDQYGQNNPYNEGGPRPDVPGAPVIRDNPARRNTRIENPSHYPQQSAGISQNF